MADTLVYPKTLSDHELNPAWIQFQWFERIDISKSELGDCIQLYMPEQAAQPSTVHWDQEAFGFIGRTFASAGQAAAGKGYREGMSAGMSSIAGKSADAWDITKARVIASVGANAAQALGGNVSVEGLMGQVAGKIPNPYLTMVFRGVDFRSFVFSFKFAPFSESDCDIIDKIVKSFRSNATPPGKGSKQGPAFLGYPNECEISYWWKGNQNQWLHKFKRSVCTGVDVDYTAAGMFSVMRNGFPAEIVVNLKFSEIELVLRDDIKTDRY